MAVGFEAKLGAVLEPLYASVLDPGRLGDFSAALCAATGSHVGAVMAHDAQHAGGRMDLLVGVDAEFMATYEQEYASDNIWMQRSQHLMQPGAVLDSDEAAPRSEMRRTRYYNEFLRIADIEQSLALCAQADADGVVVATLCRTARQAPYADRELAIAREVAPHWVNAYAIQRRLSWLERRVNTLEAAVEIAPMAMFMLDARQRLVRMNAAAESFLEQGAPLRLERRRLEASFDTLALQQLLHAATIGMDMDGRVMRSAGSMVLRDAAGRGMLMASVHPLGPIGPPDAGAAVLFVQPVEARSRSDAAALLRDAFGLTPAEAALAMALQRHGDLALAAAECRIANSTAQTRLKVVYDKTGERGQLALMRLLCAVAAACG